MGAVAVCAILVGCRTEPQGPAEVGRGSVLDPAAIAHMEAAVESAIASGDVPGAVVVIGNRDGVLYTRAFGWRALGPMPEAMTPDTIFDLASLTKPVATAASVMKLIDQGRVRPGERIAAYLPQFAVAGKESITVEQLLLHTSGLIADNSLEDYAAGPEESLERIRSLSPIQPPGSRFVYSDVGYIVLGELVRAVDGRPVDRFAREEIFAPLGMEGTCFEPAAAVCARIAPTEQGLRGTVHDPRAAALGGVAGHAGLFGTADDLASFCRMVLRGGELDGRRILSRAAVDEMTRGRVLPDGSGVRAYGFDVDTAFSSPRGLRFPRGVSFGHTGFTGTSLWIDPSHDLFVILLTSRLQAEGGGATQPLRRAVGTYAAEALLGVNKSRVLTGIDVLVHDDFAPLRGRRVGLITNHTGVDRFGRRTIDLLHTAPDVELVAIFSPEHGVSGKLDRDGIAHAKDEKTGLPIYSLYGETRRPTPAMLDGLDTLVFDIQDIGTRFYTYITTMGYAMEEAQKHGLKFIVLDRPNPIMPLGPRGPLADADKLSFIAYKPLPLVHGMTIGELANLFRGEYLPRLDLHVIGMEHYRRGMWWEHTGVEWVNPSPNMRSPTAAVLYPAIGMLEMTNLSVGRGTDTPFHWLGAPWIEGPRLAEALDESQLPGVRFEPVVFTPNASKFAGERCQGVRIVLVDRNAFDPVRTGLTIAWRLQQVYGERFDSEKVLTMLGNSAAHRAWQAAPDPAELRLNPPAEFLRKREEYLLYR